MGQWSDSGDAVVVEVAAGVEVVVVSDSMGQA